MRPAAVIFFSFVMCFAAAPLVLFAAEQEAAFSISIEEFQKLSADKQKNMIVAAFEHRLEHAKNIHYEALILVNVSRYENGRPGKILNVLNGGYGNGHPGKILNALNGTKLRHWQLGDSFRTDTDLEGVDVTKPRQFETIGFDSATGIVRSMGRRAEKPEMMGRIEGKNDRINLLNRYEYWLDGKPRREADFIFPLILAQREHFEIVCRVNEGVAELTMPWQKHYGSDKSSGSRVFALDTSKGFLPVSGHGRWEGELPNGGNIWGAEEFVVEESRLVEDVWMPIKLKEIIRSSSFQDDAKCSVLNTTVSKIEKGTVTQKDIEVPFRAGMYVVDAIKKITYTIGPDMEPVNIEPVLETFQLIPASN